MISNDTAGAQRGVLVTGASSGIGEACSLFLDSMGFHVFAGIRKEADAEALRRRASSRLLPVRLDVTESESILRAAETISAKMGDSGLYGLVNNAGIVVAGPLEFLPLDKIREQFEVNVLGQVAVIQEMLPLIRQGRGRIVNMGSISGHVALPFLAPYAASKHALEAITDSLRVELRPWGIPVSIVDPGNVATPIWGKSIAATASTMQEIPEEKQQRGADLYGPTLEALRAYVTRVKGMRVEHVVRAVVHALVSQRPRSRYYVRWDTRLPLILNVLPVTLRDRLVSMPIAGTGRGDS